MNELKRKWTQNGVSEGEMESKKCKKIDEILIIFVKAPRTVRKWTSTGSSNSKQQRGNENINKSSTGQR